MKSAYIFLAEGFEEVEALATYDVLHRGGLKVRFVSISGDFLVESSRGVNICCTYGIDEIEPSSEDVLVFPGGMPGAKNLGECKALIELMNRHYEAGGWVAAICAAPSLVLGQLKGIEKAEFTCYDGCERNLVAAGARFVKKPAVTSGRIITGRGPGHAIDFALEILANIADPSVAEKVSSAMTLPVASECLWNDEKIRW